MRTLFAVLLTLIVLTLSVGVQDEYGRNIALTLFEAAGVSILKAVTATIFIFAVAMTTALSASTRANNIITTTIAGISDLVDSVPIIIWVLVFAVAVPEPRQVMPLIAFVTVVMPYATRIVLGEVTRISAMEYVVAARAIGVSRFRILLRHVLPNATEVLRPFFIQVFGAAIALDGAIGLLSGGNRTDLNLGTFLVRGKEQFTFNPRLLTATILLYLLIFMALRAVATYRRSSV